jgi:hypothetical protein
MSSQIVTRTKTIIIAVIAAACFGTVAVPSMASSASAATLSASAGHTSAAPNVGNPWPGP